MIDNNNNQIDEADLEYLFSGTKRKKKSRAISIIKYSALFLSIAIAIFVSINYQALNKELLFWYHSEYKNDASSSNQSIISQSIKSKVILTAIPEFADNHILIPAISADAPVTWMVENTNESTSSALENGTIHLLGTATPGTIGNVFITGHSSNYAWAPGKYKSVFALLNKLSVGDLVYLKYQQIPYVYKVYEKDIIKPSDTSVLEQGSKSILTLMTCTPVGTSLNRLIIKSNQVYPDQSSNSGSNNSQATGSPPAIR